MRRRATLIVPQSRDGTVTGLPSPTGLRAWLIMHKSYEGGAIANVKPFIQPVQVDLHREPWPPVAAGAQALGCEENCRIWILTPEGGLNCRHERQVLRIVAQEPAPHSQHRAKPCA